MLYLFLAVIAIALSYFAYQENDTHNKVLFIRGAFLIVFFIYGFEYFNTVDYAVMLQKFNYVNYGVRIDSIYGEQVEPLTALLMRLCKPIGNIGYYILVAAVEIYVLYKIALRYVPLKYLWLFFVLLLINFNNVIPLMTAKRQVLSLFIVWAGVYIILENKVKHSFAIGVALIICAALFHSAAVFALFMIPIIRFDFTVNRRIQIILFLLFFVQFVIDISSFSQSIYTYVLGFSEKFAHYANDLKGEKNVTLVYFLYYLTIYSAILFNIDKFNGKERVWAKFVILYYLVFNLLPYSAGRSLMYYNMSQLFVIPILVSKINNIDIRRFLCIFAVIISLRLCYNTFSASDSSGIGNGFREFNTILEAPSLQIDNPISERKRFDDLRK